MLVVLLPSQVSEYWPLFKGHIEKSLPPTGDYGQYDMNNILYSLLAGYAQIWVYHNEKHESQGFIVTYIFTDISGVKNLIIYCAIVIDKEAKVDWQAEFEVLKKFAHSKGCSKMASYITNPKAIEKLKQTDVDVRSVYANITL
jgi:hypothetical protein